MISSNDKPFYKIIFITIIISIKDHYAKSYYAENVYYTISLLNHSTMKLYQLAAMIFINSKLKTTVVILGSIFTS